MAKTLILGAVLVLALASGASAMCPNKCSGHGSCSAYDKCTCYSNFQGADCSQRTCPSALAWVDAETGDSAQNGPHAYAECSNKGLCDRKTGQCVCFEGYEGDGCRRSSCPNQCSGHGTCETINELWGDFHGDSTKTTNDGITAGSSSDQAYDYGYHIQATCTNEPQPASETDGETLSIDSFRNGDTYVSKGNWDADKIQGCKCDFGWYGPDCSLRMCPKGDDPLTNNAGNDETEVQVIFFRSLLGAAWSSATDSFTITYTDVYGGRWTTRAILEGASAAEVQDALRAVPNRVLDAVSVAKIQNQHVGYVHFVVTFNGDNGSGPQADLEINAQKSDSGKKSCSTTTSIRCSSDYDCPASETCLSSATADGCNAEGCQPRYTGITRTFINLDAWSTYGVCVNADASGQCTATHSYATGNPYPLPAGAVAAACLDNGGSADAECQDAGNLDQTTCEADVDANGDACTWVGYGVADVCVDSTLAADTACQDNADPFDEATCEGDTGTDTNACVFSAVGKGHLCRQSDNTYDATCAAAYADRATCEAATGADTNDCVWWDAQSPDNAVTASIRGNKESAECSNRGECDSESGICACHEGYTGESCQHQTALS